MEKEGSDLSQAFRRANISLILDSYNDVFSSFDARNYSEKALSVDFLEECKRAAREKDDKGFELILSVPRAKRNLNDEIKIKKRLREHFHKHAFDKEREILRVKRMGKIWVTFGSLLIFGIVLGLVRISNVIFQSILAIFEVPGWFLVWEGMAKVFLDSKKIEPDVNFYRKMANAEIFFVSY